MTQPAKPNEISLDAPTEGHARRAQEILDRVRPATSKRFRWEFGLGILIAGSIAEAIVWNIYSPDRTYQVMWSMPAVSSTMFLLLLWWIFFCGLTRRAKGIGVGALVLGVGLFMALFRFEGFNGDMWPRFVLRTSPTAEERLIQFLTDSKQKPTPTTKPKKEVDQKTTQQLDPPSGSEPEPMVEQLVADKNDWTGFRGANRDGIVNAQYEFDWIQPLNEVWRHPVGRAWSSFAVVGGYGFTQEQREQGESVVCYQVATGATIWRHSDPVRFDEAMGGVGPRATPTFSDGHLYTLGATGVLNCLNATNGDVVWQRNILDDADVANIPWAMAGSPLVVDHLVIVNPGGKNGNGVIAYEKETGKRAWSAGNDQASYSAPVYREVLGTAQVVIFDGVGLAGHSIDDGRQFWKVDWSNDAKVNAAQPIVLDGNSIFVGSGYGRGSGLIEFAQDADRITTNVKWSSPRFKLKFNAAVQDRFYAYGIDEGVLSCIDMRDGSMQWKRGRYGYGQLVRVGDMLVIQTEQGDVAFVRATPKEFEEVQITKALSTKSWNHPVIWKNLLIVRNAEECVCYEISGTKRDSTDAR